MKLRSLLCLIILPMMLFLAGCYSASVAKLRAIGTNATITVYSGGQPVKVYHSTGKVFSEPSSDGWYFEDRTTHKLVMVAGTVTVEQE